MKKLPNENAMKHMSLLITAVVFVWLGPCDAPNVFGVVPAPDGGYAGGNTAEGQDSLLSLTTGTFNTAVGFLSLESNTTGNLNTATGAGALLLNTADNNTATGAGALLSNATGDGNTANGTFALFTNTAGVGNTATGFNALLSNNTGSSNAANGADALFSNTTGEENTANGVQALLGNTTGSRNSAFGSGALASNTTAIQNTATGVDALADNLTGDNNTANGFNALASNTTGFQNTAIGDFALINNVSGVRNIGLGHFAGSGVTTANEVICIGSPGANVSTSCFIGHIRGVTTANADAIPVLIDSDGQLGTVSSSKRFKKDITSMSKTSEAILALRPVTFHYKSDKTDTPQFGLIAEEVEKVNPNLVVRDKNGELYTVRYDAVNAMLLNEFLKEHCTVLELKKEIAALTATMKEQAAQIQKVNARLDLQKPALQTVVYGH